eukprot:TRINITY_DN2238_c0_g2_i1.p1 TRINITY_DN2238_c0_g2~~TRINITY_DN2238_c0_g2_i1.p1  ORF type:complete len:486 (+),score=224.20 TRINITY_DN2238_c0_g2_i1:68-1525(+)
MSDSSDSEKKDHSSSEEEPEELKEEMLREEDEEDDDDEVYEGEDEEEAEDVFGVMDCDTFVKDATKRLAIQHLDWDTVTAQDIYVLVSSFLPPGGRLARVSIYPSDFGIEMLEKEEANGPDESIWKSEEKSLRRLEGKEDDDDGEFDAEGSAFDPVKLRKYEIQKLRYYFAIAEFDSASTAYEIYQACNGIEVEASSNVLDVRFVPDDVSFKEKEKVLKDRCDTAPPSGYRLRGFQRPIQAIQLSTVDMSWDVAPNAMERRAVLIHGHGNHDDFIAFSSDEEEEEKGPDGGVSEEKRQRYRSLLEVDREVTFVPKESNDPNDKLPGLEDGPKGVQDVEDDDWESDHDGEEEEVLKEDEEGGKGDDDDGDDIDGLSEDDDEEAHASRKVSKKQKKAKEVLSQKGKKEKKSKRGKKRSTDDEESDEDDELATPAGFEDERFKAAKSDPRFAIDPTGPEFKSGKRKRERGKGKKEKKGRSMTKKSKRS